MKIIAFPEAHQSDIIRKILQHCGLPLGGPKGWQGPPTRNPPNLTHTSHPGDQPHGPNSRFSQADDPDSRLTYEVDPEFLEFARREELEEPEPIWEPGKTPQALVIPALDNAENEGIMRILNQVGRKCPRNGSETAQNDDQTRNLRPSGAPK